MCVCEILGVCPYLEFCLYELLLYYCTVRVPHFLSIVTIVDLQTDGCVRLSAEGLVEFEDFEVASISFFSLE